MTRDPATATTPKSALFCSAPGARPQDVVAGEARAALSLRYARRGLRWASGLIKYQSATLPPDEGDAGIRSTLMISQTTCVRR
ncbi:hypothetical protein EVAR_7525_1 [Eumeta japonica]|uniref:Uncharacterized protein n=1 Tax=Eumeta variegata TaxID=151549 RepID=A0A4C2A9D5_EUMVA|nr:hypothetical protein EVAR_7525_1 [Eumeta japonica]